jgi:hypothetical protein
MGGNRGGGVGSHCSARGASPRGKQMQRAGEPRGALGFRIGTGGARVWSGDRRREEGEGTDKKGERRGRGRGGRRPYLDASEEAMDRRTHASSLPRRRRPRRGGT